MDQKWPNSDFQPQSSISINGLIHLKIIFYLVYWISRRFFIIAVVQLTHFLETLFSEKWPYFCCIIRNPKQVQL